MKCNYIFVSLYCYAYGAVGGVKLAVHLAIFEIRNSSIKVVSIPIYALTPSFPVPSYVYELLTPTRVPFINNLNTDPSLVNAR